VAKTEAEILAKKRAERDKRYRAKYYVGIEFYDALLAAQDGKCGACGRPHTDFSVSLNVDHFHFRVLAQRLPPSHPLGMRWYAFTQFDGQKFEGFAPTKASAIELVKRRATPHSIRGLLCPGRYTGCNRLMGRIDRPDWLKRVVHYLENPPAKKVVDLLPKI
jgi:hypothetical protein